MSCPPTRLLRLCLLVCTHCAGQVALILGERALLAALRRRGVTLPELIRIGLTLVSDGTQWLVAGVAPRCCCCSCRRLGAPLQPALKCRRARA